VLWRGDVGKSGGTATLTHENGGALEQRRWHATLEHDGDAVLGHGGCRASVGGEVTVGGGQAPSASDTKRWPVGALWHGHGTLGGGTVLMSGPGAERERLIGGTRGRFYSELKRLLNKNSSNK
jgi:hypothetical protein